MATTPRTIPAESVRAALRAMIASPAFEKSERAGRFVNHLVETALRGESYLLKESLLGTEVFGREPGWDPKLDPVVRQEASRLRKRIARYYEEESSDPEVRIEIPVGTYVPVFHRSIPAPEPAPPVLGIEPAVAPAAVPRSSPKLAWWIGVAAAGILLAALAGLGIARLKFGAPAETDRSIAVIPFMNRGGNAADRYFADGLTDEITDTLTRQRKLRVVARSSAAQFRDKVLDLQTAGRELNVAWVLEGSVARLGERVRVTAGLERVADGSRVWSKTWERQGGDLPGLRSELAAAIAASLQANVTGRQSPKHTTPEDVHDLYMQGRYELEQMTPESVDRAAAILQKTVDRDPEYAAAYYALGQAKWTRVTASASQAQDPVRKESAALFRRALELDPDLSDAHAGLANYAMQYDWDWTRAEDELRAGLMGDPSVAVENSYAFLLVFQNRFAEADEHIRRSQELDPIGAVSVENRALLWSLEGHFARSREEFQRMLQRAPNLIPARYMVAFTYIEEGNPTAAAPILRELDQRTPVVRMFEAMEAAREGRKADALQLMHPFEQRYPEPGVANQWFALVYAFLGDEDNTVKWLTRSVDRHEWQALNLGVHSAYASMRDSAGFRALRKRMGLP